LKPHLAQQLKRALRDLTSDTQFIDQIEASIPADAASSRN